MATTQKQIAQQLGISQALVAQALRGYPGVAEITRQRVVATATEMGYSSLDNVAARSLIARRHGSRPKTGQIAVLMGDVMDGLTLQEMPFFREILQGIHHTAAEDDIDVAIHVLRLGNLPRTVLLGDIDGAICIYNNPISQDLERAGVTMPIVRLGSYEPQHWSIYPDDCAGTLATTRHLIQRDHTRIAYIGINARSQGTHSHVDVPRQRREEGFRAALDEANLSPVENWIVRDAPEPSFSSGRDAAETLFNRSRDFTAIVCAHDSLALGAIDAARSAGFRVPEDISITGFDGTMPQSSSSDYGSSSTLTTAFFNRRIMGRRAVEMLEKIAIQPEQPPQHEVLPIRLLVRGSTTTPINILV